jgi:hypothetical protein
LEQAQILKIIWMPTQQYLEEKIFPYFWDEKFDSAYWQFFRHLPIIEAGDHITIETSNGIFKVKYSTGKIEWIKDYFLAKKENLNQIFKSATLEISITNDNLAVITIQVFNDDKLPAEFYSILPQIKDCKGFLIDVRGMAAVAHTTLMLWHRPL